MTSVPLLALAAAWVLLARAHPWPRPARIPGRPSRGDRSSRSGPRSAATLTPTARWVLAILGAGLVTVAVGPVIGAGVLAAPVGGRWLRARRRRRDAQAAVIEQVPEVIDLLALAGDAGLTVTESIAAVGRWAPGPVGSELAAVSVAVGHGAAAGDALDVARRRCGPGAEGLFAALAGADRYGTPLGPTLDRLGHEARLDRRREAEERARRVPVRLLFPLVVCILPAFGLLTVVPLLVNSLGALAS